MYVGHVYLARDPRRRVGGGLRLVRRKNRTFRNGNKLRLAEKFYGQYSDLPLLSLPSRVAIVIYCVRPV